MYTQAIPELGLKSLRKCSWYRYEPYSHRKAWPGIDRGIGGTLLPFGFSYLIIIIIVIWFFTFILFCVPCLLVIFIYLKFISIFYNSNAASKQNKTELQQFLIILTDNEIQYYSTYWYESIQTWLTKLRGLCVFPHFANRLIDLHISLHF